MMKYEILDKPELDAGVEFYQAYFYGNGERSLLLKHLETWPSHANWLVAEILFFLKNHDQDSRWPNGGIGYDIRDDQIWMYFTTGIDENILARVRSLVEELQPYSSLLSKYAVFWWVAFTM